MGKTASGYTKGNTMTLFKQIALLVATVFIVLLIVILLNDLDRIGKFQQGQLQNTAQDMSTTLGIAVSNLPDGNDQATLEVLFNAVFDSGYYTRIELVGNQGQVLHRKSQELTVEGVPEWFINLVPLWTARGSTQVMKGWTQLGQLNLELHPGFAYKSLYESLIATLWWFVSFLLASIAVLWLFLRYLLEPLGLVKNQADAIRRNKFVQQQKIPKTLELKRVVEAMNLMVSKVQSIFDDQQQTLANYQKLLYQDKLTGLGNRQYLLDQLQQSLSESSGQHGSMAIVKVIGFEQIRERHGYQISDSIIQIIGDLLQQSHAGHTVECIARFNDDEFAFLSAGDESIVTPFLETLFEQFHQLADSPQEAKNVQLVAGSCNLASGEDIGKILSSIDYCLFQAINKGPFSIETKLSNSLNLPQGKMQWRSWLESVLEDQRLFLVGQLAYTTSTKVLHRELFIRARDEQGQIIPAAAFMPIASSLGMALDIDKEVFRMVSENSELDREIPVALNLSSTFFQLAEAQEGLNQLLSRSEKAGQTLCLEASHHILAQHPVMRAKVSERARKNHHQFGIDNLDLSQSLQLLQSAHFDYVKINANTLHDMSRNDMTAGYKALRTITDTMDIRIIAVGVDSQLLFDELKSLGIEAMQGNHLGSTDPI